MARKIASAGDTLPPTPPAPDTASDVNAEDFSILHPDVTLTLAGRTVTVREYRLIDGWRARERGAPIIAALTQLVESGQVVDATTDDYLDLLARHGDLVRSLMADSIEGADPDWIDSLSLADGEQLAATWWSVCGRFFVRRVAAKEYEKLLRTLREEPPAGSTSSSPSPEPSTPLSDAPATTTRSAN